MSPTNFNVPDLYDALHHLLGQIPRGRVTTYGALGRALGHVAAARWVGEYLLDHPHHSRCPCHRVVRKEGALGLYVSGDVEEKRRRLEHEGVAISNGVVDLDQYLFDDFVSDTPLESLVRLQTDIAVRVEPRTFAALPDIVGGLDVSYMRSGEAIGVYAVVETETCELVWSTSIRTKSPFPYISGFLSFRELPIHLRLIDAARRAGRLAPLLFVDGNGVLHPRGAGVAAHCGVLADLPTIGIGKKLLCGQVDLSSMTAEDTRDVLREGRRIGVAVKAKDHFRPIFASCGQYVDAADAGRLTRLLFRGHRLPEPLFHADRLSRQASRSEIESTLPLV